MTSATIGREVRRGVGRAGRYSSSSYQRLTQTDQFTFPRRRPINGARSGVIVHLNSDGEEVEEENNNYEREEFERSNDEHQSSFIDNIINEGRSAYDLFNRYAEHVLPERIETLTRENAQLRAEYQRLSNRLG